MSNQYHSRLAYTKSPKTTKRTTFQDELHAAVSARASKKKTDYSYPDDFNDDDDDFLNKLLNSRKKNSNALKAGKSKAKINDFQLSDDEEKHGRTKKVSFLKNQRLHSPSEDTAVPELHENDPPDSSVSGHNSYNNSVPSQHSANVSEDNTQISRDCSSKSLSYQMTDDSMSLPLPSDDTETPGPEERSSPVMEENSEPDLGHEPAADDATEEREPPRPKPRQRTLGMSLHAAEMLDEETELQDLDESGSRDDIISNDSKEHGRKYSTSFEEFHEESGDCTDHSAAQLSQIHGTSFDTRTSSSYSKMTHRSQSACSRNVESKYLGTLKVLDRKVSLQESQQQAADSLRAAVYQEWLKKKKEKSRENMKLKKKEEILKEEKKREEEAHKEDAAASYEAWKEKKTESLKAKAKEKEDKIRKEQKAKEEKEERKQSAQQVFEKWKHDHDHLLKDKYRKQKEAEDKLKLEKQEKEEERKSESTSAFSSWCEKKKDDLQEKLMKERKEIKNKAEEEQYMKEERDKMALEMYENWLSRKDLEQKRQREERRIKAIIGDSPPPPWSPPNKTIPARQQH